MPKFEKVLLYTDGGSRGNPGKSAIGILITSNDDKPIMHFAQKIGITTNNQAEYTALIKGLEFSKKLKINEIACFSDSEVMVKQLNGFYKVKKPELKELYAKVTELIKAFKTVTFAHVPREHPRIMYVDKLLNDELDLP